VVSTLHYLSLEVERGMKNQAPPKSWIQIWAPPLALLAVALFGLYETGVFADTPAGEQPDNWHEVAPKNFCAPGKGAGPRANGTIFRGGRPDAEGLQYLQAQDFKAIVNLEVRKQISDEEELIRQLGLGLLEIAHPMPNAGVIQRPDGGGDYHDAVIAAIAEFRKTENFPLYVHCHLGKDRTGMIVAFHRVLNECWKPEDAESEWDGIEGWWEHLLQRQKHQYFNKVLHDPALRAYFEDQLQKQVPAVLAPIAQPGQPVAQPAPMKEPGGVAG
jgi:hypothetical protein